jgi:large subunit ribosomal protein L23
MTRFASDLIRTPLRTEKGTRILSHRTYLFKVVKDATKPQIRRAVEDLYKVKVIKVNTAVMPGKPRRVGARWGYRPGWKKAAVTLAEGSKIEGAA